MVDIEVIGQRSGIDELARQESLDVLQAALAGAPRPPRGLASMLLADNGDEAVEESGLGAQQAPQLAFREQTGARLEEEVAEDRVSGEVAAQDGVQADAVTGREPGLDRQGRRDRRRSPLLAPDRVEGVIEGRDEGGAQAVGVGGVGNVRGVGDRLDADGSGALSSSRRASRRARKLTRASAEERRRPAAPLDPPGAAENTRDD